MPSHDPTILRLQSQRYRERNRERINARERGRKRDRREYQRRMYYADPERRRERSRKYRFFHQRELAERKREYYLRNRARLLAKQKAYYENNKEKCLAQMAVYAKNRPEKHREARARYEQKNLATIAPKRRALARAYYYRHQEEYKARSRHYGALRKRRIRFLGNAITSKQLQAFVLTLKASENLKCTYCGLALYGQPFHVDHMIPISRGGKHEISNLCAACEFCNLSKKDKTPEEFAEYNRKLLKER